MTATLTINADGAMLSGNNAVPVLLVDSSANVTISNVTISGECYVVWL